MVVNHAGVNLAIKFSPCSDCMPGPAERALAKHRYDVRDVLITLFEKPIPEADVVSREVVTRVLGKTVDWTKPVLDVATNPHLKDLVRPGVPPIVWETKERKGSFARSVLDPSPLLDRNACWIS